MNEQNISNDNREYRSTDLALVTAISLSVPIKDIEKSYRNKAVFIFEKDSLGKFDELLQKYWQRNLLVEPQAYFTQLKIIKSRIYGEA